MEERPCPRMKVIKAVFVFKLHGARRAFLTSQLRNLAKL